ncbi:MAG: hypothetical protein H0X16_06830 [Chloroflexi bacterium]|nr:hypothetical protein [Chloroflexota bacterium]
MISRRLEDEGLDVEGEPQHVGRFREHRATRPLRWVLGAVLALAMLPASASAIPAEGCRQEFIFDLPPDGAVVVNVRFNPDQRVNIGVTRPGGGGDAAEWPLRTAADGTLRRTLTAQEIGLTGRVVVVVLTGKPCERADGRTLFEVTLAEELPATDVSADGPLPVPGPPLFTLGVIGWLVATYVLLRPLGRTSRARVR